MTPSDSPSGAVPLSALVLSLISLAIPVAGALLVPDLLGESGALLWLLALIPAFLFAYHRGWKGAATALAAGMATLSLTQAVASALGVRPPEILVGIVVAYVAIAMSIGWLAEIMHKDRSEVEEMAFTDALTGLPNRRHAQVFLANEFAAAERGRELAVALFDLDHFKGYNDLHGHQAGDAALVAFAGVLERTTRRMNLCARIGGEEFIAILAGSDQVGATIFADRVRIALHELGLGEGPLTCSAGIAVFDGTLDTPEALIAAADRALYAAKAGGRNRVLLHTPTSALPPEEVRRASVDAREETGPIAPLTFAGLGKGKRALLIEDDLPVQGMIADFMRREGFELQTGASVAEGLSAISEEFDIVITDLRLPDASGHQLVAEVKSRWPHTPSLVITGVVDANLAADALHAGAVGYLFKPFGMSDLQMHVGRALDRRAADQVDAEAFQAMEVEARARARAAGDDVVRGALSLVRAVEVRDPYTRGHSRRVAAFAHRIAEEVDPDGVLLPRDRLSLGCELHDVGKIGIPDLVLNKAGRLTPEEFQKIREHPGVGRRILEPMIQDEFVLGIVGSHHENWDGSGYPEGIAEEAIPPGARVVALADSLAAMVHPRAHRAALDWNEATEEILAGAGTLYDPKLVTAVGGILKELEEISSDPSLAELPEPG